MTGHVHKEVAKVAQAAAAELYERLMGDNTINAEWRRQNPGATARQLELRFIRQNWGRCIPFARATMARLLTTNIDDKTKESIMEALTLDSTLVRGRATGAAEIIGRGVKR